MHTLVCYRTPQVDFSPWRYLGTEAPPTEMYDRSCRTCICEDRFMSEEPLLDSDDNFTSEESDEESYDAMGPFDDLVPGP